MRALKEKSGSLNPSVIYITVIHAKLFMFTHDEWASENKAISVPQSSSPTALIHTFPNPVNKKRLRKENWRHQN